MSGIGLIANVPLMSPVAAISVGVVRNNMLLDLCYDEDSQAAVDFNVVMTSKNEFIEVQGTAEGKPFTKETMDTLLALAGKGITQLFEIQKSVLEKAAKL